MTDLFKFTSVLFLSASFFLASCSKHNMKGTVAGVTMRPFAQADAGPGQLEEGEIKRISHEVSDNWKSTVFKMEEGRMVSCDCDMDDFEITQVFLKPRMWLGQHTFLYQDNSTTNATHVFTGEDVIGIDMKYNGEYVRMSDIDVFSQSQGDGQYLYADELGVEVFANASTGTNSAVYYFPILSNQDDPGNSLSGMWMRIVLDFN